jgi:NAD(P)H dehydrogenase (quinone)
MSVKVNVVFYSMYGHIYKMAEAVAEGAKSTGAQVGVFQIAETLPDNVLEQYGAKAAKAAFAKVPVATLATLTEADAIIFGTPTRFGNMAGQMRNFLDSTGQIWFSGGLIGKVGSVFASTASQHGGQETTITSFHSTLLHHGMIVVGVPYSDKALLDISAVSGGTPYGATTIAGGDGSRQPSENELHIAKFQGKHVAEITAKLFR